MTTKRSAEAAAGSYEARRLAVRAALDAMRTDDEGYPTIVAMFDRQVVVGRGAALTRYDYEIGADGTAVLSAPARVEETFRVAPDAAFAAHEAAAVAVAGGTPPPRGGELWRVRAIRAGASLNGTWYPAAVLREAAPRFDGARVLVRSDEDHLAGRGADVRNIAGRIAAPAFVEGAGPDAGAIEADFEVLEPEGPVARLLRAARERGMLDLMGLSIVARGRARAGEVAGRRVALVESIDRVESVDLVVEPAAGGALIGLVEAARRQEGATPAQANEEKDMTLRERMLATIEARLPERAAALDRNDDAAVEAAYREAAAGPAAARAAAREAVESSGLPQAARARLRERFADAAAGAPDTAAVREAIEGERAYLAAAAPGGQVAGLGQPAGAVRVEDRRAKVAAMWDALLDPADATTVSLRAAWVETTGDARVSGLLRECDAARLREAVASGGLGELLGDSIARRMIADYRQTGIHDHWTRWCAAGTVTDFRTQRRVRWGGYSNLPTVAESAAYAALTTPGDEEETYAPGKRGGTESVTLEAIRNDDVMAMQRLPAMLSRAAKRTLSAFASSFLTANAALADGKALFHADHDNLGSAALSKTALAAGRLAMVKQKEPDSDKPLGIGPRSLLVPFDLEETAVDLFRRSTNHDRNFVQSLALDAIPIPELTDANDWYLAADPMDIPTVEIGFLDGRREPELFVQDSPTAGSLFTNDRITWKIRHVYGGAALDFRGLYKSAVA